MHATELDVTRVLHWRLAAARPSVECYVRVLRVGRSTWLLAGNVSTGGFEITSWEASSRLLGVVGEEVRRTDGSEGAEAAGFEAFRRFIAEQSGEADEEQAAGSLSVVRIGDDVVASRVGGDEVWLCVEGRLVSRLGDNGPMAEPWVSAQSGHELRRWPRPSGNGGVLVISRAVVRVLGSAAIKEALGASEGPGAAANALATALGDGLRFGYLAAVTV